MSSGPRSRVAPTVVQSVECWLGLADAGSPTGWRSWWAPVLWYAVAAWMALSVIRFFVNPLFAPENAVILAVLVLYVGNARRIRQLLARRRTTDERTGRRWVDGRTPTRGGGA